MDTMVHSAGDFCSFPKANDNRLLSDLCAAIIESSHDAIFGQDLNGIITTWNKGAEEIYGYTAEEIKGTSIMRLIPADRRDEELHILRRIERGESVGSFDTMRRTRDGRLINLSITASPIKTAAGAIVGVSKVTRDITQARKSQARFRRLVESNAQAVFFWNRQGGITGCNDAFLNLVSYDRADLSAGRIGWVAITPPEYADRDRRALDETAAHGDCAMYEKEFIRKDGSRVPILIGAAVFEDNPDDGVCFVLDLTERKRLEDQLRQAQKMEGIGHLAGGVAHEFNNLLAVIQMETDYLKGESGLTAGQSESADNIATTVQSAAALTRQLLLFSSRALFQPRDFDLSASVAATANMFKRIIGANIAMRLKLAPQPMTIKADPGMMDQVLLNLVLNARDAMPNGGRLVIETSASEFDQVAVAQSPEARVGSFLCLSVSDDGSGIQPEILPNIFEPFFTTKDIGQGTGIGLAAVFGIVHQHRGWINIESPDGHGTTVRIYLPRV